MGPLTKLTSQQLALQELKAAKEGYCHRALVAIDQCLNVIFLNGRPDETISAHSARAALEGKKWGIYMSEFLNLFQSNHGEKAIAGDLERAQSILNTEDEATKEN